MEAFQKILSPTVTGDRGGIPVFVKVIFDGTRLSITGVEGPRRNGNCYGGCGQIKLDPAAASEGWTAEMVEKLSQVWKAWHLNDMRAGCEHQRVASDPSEKVEVVTYRLTDEARTQIRGLKALNLARLQAGETVTSTQDEIALLSLPRETHQAPDADGPGSGRYEVARRGTRPIGTTYPSEHPRGLLMKACPECGYQYGSTWLTEEVPADVLDFLRGLPSTSLTPAWI